MPLPQRCSILIWFCFPFSTTDTIQFLAVIPHIEQNSTVKDTVKEQVCWWISALWSVHQLTLKSASSCVPPTCGCSQVYSLMCLPLQASLFWGPHLFLQILCFGDETKLSLLAEWPHDLACLLQSICVKNPCVHTKTCTNVHIHKCQKVKTTQMSINWWRNKMWSIHINTTLKRN